MRKFLKVLLLTAPPLLLGCKTTKPRSSIKHTLGDMSWSDGSWTYLDLDRDTFIKMNSSTYLGETHPLSLKAKEWVDRLHSAVLRKYPEKMAGVPHPQIIVMKKASPDAFAAKRRIVSYKLNTKITTEQVTNSELRQTNPLYLSSNGKLSHNIFPPEITIQVENPDAYSQWFSKSHVPCTIEKIDANNLNWAYGPHCERESYLGPSHWSPEFVTFAAPNWLIVTSGLFSILPTEESFTAVLAHELAHYYRAHVVNETKRYNHCYLLTDPEHRPVARDELKSLCRALKEGRGRGGIQSAVAAAKAGLGVYTIEEEADELALEILSLASIAPIKAVDAWFALFESADANVTQIEVPFLTCKELFNNNWQDNKGNPVAIPIGDYEDTHHSWCFRVFNTTNEIKIHGYQVPQPRSLDPAQWTQLQRLSLTP